MSSVTERIRATAQPRGGYLPSKMFERRQLDGTVPGVLDHKIENVAPVLVGTAVDYLARLANGALPRDAFAISLMGARLLGWSVQRRAKRDVGSLTPGRVDADAISAACRLVSYDVALRAGKGKYNPDVQTDPDAVTLNHIAIMVERSGAFFGEYGPITLDGFTFDGGYTKTVDSGDGDFLTADTLWEFKVSVSGPTKEHTLQLLMYLLMGRRSGQRQFAGLTHIGIFNPRLNSVYRFALSDVPVEVISEVSSKVIGYK